MTNPDVPTPSRPLPVWPWLLLALAVILLDQVSKHQIIQHLRYGERVPVASGFFDLTLLYNPGAAFSFLAGHSGWQRWFFAGIAMAASAVILSLLFSQRQQRMFCCALALILGGAIGNLIDRLVMGHVTDFLLFYHDAWYFPAFNLADCAITLGAALLIGHELVPWLRSRTSRT
ncbi:MAG: signal peptidase II [Lautropia sp.]|nr:signal peptidase II [Lautropia sp.]